MELNTQANPPHLRRVLKLWDLVIFGLILIQPVAPVGIFGLTQKLSQGHVSTAILAGMVAMMMTAFSYGRLAVIYPSAGSAYTYVSRGLNPHVGSLIGWAMVLEYLVMPVVSTIYPALTFMRLFPQIPYTAWVVLLVGLVVFLNLLGIRFTARTNEVLMVVISVVVIAFFYAAIRYLFRLQGWGGLISLQPFYDPKTFNFAELRTATSLATLTYVGFDGVTTLAEEVENPRRTVPLATVLVCFICGILSLLQVYLGSRVWPDYNTFPNLETAFIDVCSRVGGVALFNAMAVILIITNVGTSLAAVGAAARLLYGMGRDNILPQKFFARLDSKRNVPAFNVWVIGFLSLIGTLLVSYERSAELLNFGAFLAFMGVNAACICQFYFRSQAGRSRNFLTDLLVPGFGLIFCFEIWRSLPHPALWAGGIWFAIGLVYMAIRTQGFRLAPPKMDLSEL